jgi:hypothetical protein
MPENLTRGEIQDLLMKFSKSNPKYREALLKNPKLVVEGQMAGKIPDGITVKAMEETPNTIYVIVPYVPKPGAELSDRELEAVAGGKGLGSIGGAIGTMFGGPVGGAIGGAVGGMLDGGGGSGGGGGGSHGGGDTYTCNSSQGGQNTRVEFNAGVTLK